MPIAYGTPYLRQRRLRPGRGAGIGWHLLLPALGVERGSGYAVFSCDGLGINTAFKLLDGLHHLRLAVDLLFHTVLPMTKGEVHNSI